MRFKCAAASSVACVALACASGNPTVKDVPPGVCGIQVSSDADVTIPSLFGSARLVGHLEDEVVDSGFRPGGTRSFTVDCDAKCVVVQGSGSQVLTERTVTFEGVADLRAGEFVRLRMTRKSGNDNPNVVALRRGCIVGL